MKKINVIYAENKILGLRNCKTGIQKNYSELRLKLNMSFFLKMSYNNDYNEEMAWHAVVRMTSILHYLFL